jgi:cell division protein FtsZ
MKMGGKQKSCREKIEVWGVGNWGANILKMLDPELNRRVKTVVVNSDLQSLICSSGHHKLQIGKKLTRGRGTGGESKTGERAFQESENLIRKTLGETEILLLITGLGGGLGSAVTPALCRLADEMRILTLVLATRPFEFEGKKKSSVFNKSLEQIRKSDACLVWFNLDRLLGRLDENTPWQKAFQHSDRLLRSAVECLVSYLTAPPGQGGDWAVLKNLFYPGGETILGTHEENDPQKLVVVMKGALSSLFLSVQELNTVNGCLIQIQSGKPLSLGRVRQAISTVAEMLNENVNLAFSVQQQQELGDKVRVNLLVSEKGPGKEKDMSAQLPVTMKAEFHPPKQTEMDFNKLTRGSFSGTEPTVREGEDLDIPTFIRKGDKLF